MRTTPAYFGLRYEVASFVTADGVVLHGWFIPHDFAERVILFCHGNRGNISEYMETLVMFQKMGVAVFAFDYRGYGRSEGRASEKGIYMDAEAALSHLRTRDDIDHSKIVLFGRSLGSAVAVWPPLRDLNGPASDQVPVDES